MWNNVDIKVQLIKTDFHFLHVQVNEKDMDPWLLTVVYASPREHERRGVQADISNCLQFNRWINECNLMEVTTAGTKFTWRGPQWNGRDRVFKKLDRVLCNVSWRLKFHQGFAKVLPRLQSDHHPIIIILDGETNMGRNRPFRYEAAWATHDNFRQLLQENWIRGRDLVDVLSNLTSNLKVWNKVVFGNIFKRKKELLARLNGIQNSSNYDYSNFLETLENELQQQLTTTLYQEECLWYQKSRGKWIGDGDRNTKYYHSKAIVRRRRNKIVSLRSETGDWIEDQEALSNMAMNFYTNLYHEDIPIRDPVVSWTTYPQNLQTEHHKLRYAVQYAECKRALFDMGPHKAPGEDGYPTLFFQQNWDIVVDSVHHFVNQVWSNPSLISLINNTLLVLIPKVDKPEFISQFRPIALWRTIHHNIIVAQEMVHSMAKMKGNKMFMSIKIDLEKAYDRLNWNFVEQFLNDCRSGPKISHIFFADDLLLFVEASIEQAHCIMHCLELFCEASCQKINSQKTQIFFSKNVDQQLRNDIINHTGYTPATSLVAGNTKSVLSSIPYYHMQYAKLPKTLCDEMEKIQRGFLWGDTEQTRKPHLINWDVCCLPKVDGGIGIKRPHQMNEAFLMKILWNMINRPDVLWSKVLYNKYERNTDLRASIISQPYDSPLWKTLAGIGDHFRSHTVWQVGNGQQINFWLDKWMPDGHTLMNLSTQQIVDTTLTIKDTVNDTGNWDLNFLTTHLPQTVVNQLVAIPTPKETDGPDSLGWVGTNTRQFTVQSAYYLQCGNYLPIVGNWKSLWDWKGPHIIQTFMWITAHECLLTNYRRNKWGNGIAPTCPICGNADETIIHVLRDCSYANQLWIELAASNHITNFFSLSCMEWIFDNMEKAHDREWKTIFMITCWHLWMWRNKSIFEEDFRRPNNPTHVILKMSREVDRCEQTHLDGWTRQNDIVFIVGSSLMKDGSSLTVMTLTKVLLICHDVADSSATTTGVTHLQVESDSKVLVDLVTGNCKVNRRIPTLIRRIRALKNLDWQVQINHIWREGHKPADWLANVSLTLNSFDLHTFETHPRELQSLIFDDFSGACMPRSVRLVS
ncbi:hypothetical protein TSUD_60910 [Trifolium subterraneum]|uniref:Reverse transcriptase domain-containing protein n=1 Tax=Trifolium subterraneum TaxID=3900 RepID=A0A2Z6NRH2_TRISU|nr:hypothetical protein TSUD_60910 [Trifolium subterraneum]